MKKRVLLVGIVAALSLLACQPQFLSKPADPAATGPAGPTGSIQMKISPLSPLLAEALGVRPQSAAPSSKTFAIISKVDLRLLQSGLPTTFEKTVNVGAAPGPGAAEPIYWEMIPAGDGYQVEAWTYNGNVSTTTPLLHGISDTFSVVSGTDTEVVVRPIPISPTDVPLAPSSVQTTLNSCWQAAEPDVYGWGEERWFEIDATGHDAIRVNADPSANSAVFFLIADQDGRSRIMALSGAMNGGPIYWNFGGIASAGILTPDPTWYVGLITLSNVLGSSVLSTVDVSFEPFNDDAYEENDSIADARTVNKAQVYDCVDLDPVNWSGYPSTGGDWYMFTLTALDDPNVSVRIVFDHDESNLALELYQWTGPDPLMIAESDTSNVSGPGDPEALEMELIEQTLAPGTYYIWVNSGNPNGCSYQLQWMAGTGGIIIGIE